MRGNWLEFRNNTPLRPLSTVPRSFFAASSGKNKLSVVAPLAAEPARARPRWPSSQINPGIERSNRLQEGVEEHTLRKTRCCFLPKFVDRDTLKFVDLTRGDSRGKWVYGRRKVGWASEPAASSPAEAILFQRKTRREHACVFVPRGETRCFLITNRGCRWPFSGSRV